MAETPFFDKDNNVDFPKTITRDIHDHEVLLSFNDDSQAECFLDWWRDEGLDMFKSYADNNEEEYI